MGGARPILPLIQVGPHVTTLSNAHLLLYSLDFPSSIFRILLAWRLVFLLTLSRRTLYPAPDYSIQLSPYALVHCNIARCNKLSCPAELPHIKYLIGLLEIQAGLSILPVRTVVFNMIVYQAPVSAFPSFNVTGRCHKSRVPRVVRNFTWRCIHTRTYNTLTAHTTKCTPTFQSPHRRKNIAVYITVPSLTSHTAASSSSATRLASYWK